MHSLIRDIVLPFPPTVDKVFSGTTSKLREARAVDGQSWKHTFIHFTPQFAEGISSTIAGEHTTNFVAVQAVSKRLKIILPFSRYTPVGIPCHNFHSAFRALVSLPGAVYESLLVECRTAVEVGIETYITVWHLEPSCDIGRSRTAVRLTRS